MIAEILLYKGFDSDLWEVSNDGTGEKITRWDISSPRKPSQSKLNQWANEPGFAVFQSDVRSNLDRRDAKRFLRSNAAEARAIRAFIRESGRDINDIESEIDNE